MYINQNLFFNSSYWNGNEKTLRPLQKARHPEAIGHSIENCESKDINMKFGVPKMPSKMFIVCKVAN